MNNPVLQKYQRFGLAEVLDQFDGLALRPSSDGAVCLSGELGFRALHPSTGVVEDRFFLEISIPDAFPAAMPRVRELAGRIPRTFHKLHDGSLCLGSPFQLRKSLQTAPTLKHFVETCVIPYLVGFSVFEKTGTMPFDELQHGYRGLLDEYRNETGAPDDACCIAFLHLLGMKKRIANQRPCPCGSGVRLGKCHNKTLNQLRSVASRAYFRGTARELERTATKHATGASS